jgi:hypothetical protein
MDLIECLKAAHQARNQALLDAMLWMAVVGGGPLVALNLLSRVLYHDLRDKINPKQFGAISCTIVALILVILLVSMAPMAWFVVRVLSGEFSCPIR